MSNEQEHYEIIGPIMEMVPMRDGVRLATNIYRPGRDGIALDGPFPIILARTPYGKDWGGDANFFVSRGYVMAVQDLRHRYDSEGDGGYYHVVTPQQGEDGYDTVEWLAAQPWSNGRIGTYGASFVGIVQQVMALHRPPHLTAIWPTVAPINSHEHQAREGGAFQLYMFGAMFLHALHAREALRDPAVQRAIAEDQFRMRELVARTPYKPGETSLALVPSLEGTLLEYYYRGCDDDYWRNELNSQKHHFARHADIPGTFMSGWYDPFAGAAATYWRAMHAQNKSFQRLILGPWWHSGFAKEEPVSGDVDFGPAAAWGIAGYFEEHLRWFDRWLRELPNDLENEPPVRIFVMGGGDGRRNAKGHLNHGGTWRYESAWPLGRTQYTSFYLQPGGGLSISLPVAGEPARFDADPAHPVPCIASTAVGLVELVPAKEGEWPIYENYCWKDIFPAGAAHQKEAPGLVACREPYPLLCDRPDVLSFQTEPLREDVEVTGDTVVKLWVSSSAPDTDFTAKLLDIYPPSDDYPEGYHMNLVDSIQRARFRNGYEREEFMTPGEIYPLEIKLPPTSNLFAKGHRIRLDIAGSNFPRFDVNPNTGEPLGRHTHEVVAHNAVYLDADHPSQVILPIISAAPKETK